MALRQHETPTDPWRRPVVWGVVVGLFQAASPLAFFWLDPVLVWALAVAIIAAVYVGFAVADGRTIVIATEIAVATAFVVLAAAAITTSPWLIVIALVAHGLKDLWQHRRHFVANTRWWPPFCLVVDFVAAAVTAIVLLTGVSIHGRPVH
jgi:hypothetical protein